MIRADPMYGYIFFYISLTKVPSLRNRYWHVVELVVLAEHTLEIEAKVC